MNQKYFPADAELQIIRDLYDGSSLRLNKIMRLLSRKYPRWYVRRKAREMGLARVKEPDWSEKEEAYVYENYPRQGLKKLQAGLKLHGYRRSTTAIHLKIRRLGMTSDMDEDFTLRGLCNFLWAGQEMHKIIYRWMENGWLKGKRRGTLRTAKQGGDHWYFDPEWVRSFIIAHPEEIDLRLVDSVAFIRLVAGNDKNLMPCKCPGCGQEREEKFFNPGLRLLRIYCPACKVSHAADKAAESYRLAV